MEEKYSQEVKGKLVARSAWWVRRPDHWGCESERASEPCCGMSSSLSGRVTEAGSDLTNVFSFHSAPLHLVLPRLRPPQPPKKKKKPPQKTLRWCHSYAKQACFQRGECVCACVCERVCVCVCVCMCCLSGWFHYLKDHYTCLSTAKRPEKN